MVKERFLASLEVAVLVVKLHAALVCEEHMPLGEVNIALDRGEALVQDL